ncbi:DinB family protein [Flavobacterium selenitireducens]|uniref:DinB family protein n=1 Tax=Flavobacterium selenitireducens TaxID=2722704 RepID=UPI00168AB575|nr:DinB family protein [Flavobacterium selenitireducens]MBD3582719.1 DinB family protein [Flavobacterium selenitireducens]
MIKLFRDLFDGDPWLDSALMPTLRGISAEKAAEKPSSVVNSIWEVVYHVRMWRDVVLNRVNGEFDPTPEHNYFLEISDTSAEAWKKLLSELEQTQVDWLNFLEKVSPEKLSEKYLDSGYTVYDFIFGIMQHDAYHLGQLALLVKYRL